MSKGKKLYSFVDVDDSTPIQKLKLTDQIRILLKSWTYDPANDLHADDVVTQEYMQLKANLSEFIYKATAPIRAGKKYEVIVNISTEFNPVFKEVLNSPEITRYYDVKVIRPKIDYDIPYDAMVRFRVKKA